MSEASDHLADNINVTAAVQFIEGQSDPNERRYVFAYTIAIHNAGSAPAQLLTRHWLITDADGRIEEVHGDGVVGEQPNIAPGDTHTYSSGAILETPVGTMEGRYGMVSADGIQFDAAIPVFRLAVPGVLN
ncbi:MAG: Co2+/Mg2+ efflux protein ApaG [Gammaproteobacteria bacterium]|nr:Co2+/Mg2+ efflux protein ApaG [Gammaproteobacteria bacterium]NND53934.1 Co2+/Mg2+ efflux protein ApaG [Gammaproteobacteria bacterium]